MCSSFCYPSVDAQFIIKRMRANDSDDLSASGNPYAKRLGVEKVLELNSLENHDDVCLAYIFTYRDFADGVLGLAWLVNLVSWTKVLFKWGETTYMQCTGFNLASQTARQPGSQTARHEPKKTCPGVTKHCLKHQQPYKTE